MCAWSRYARADRIRPQAWADVDRGACAVASPSIRVGIQAKEHCVVCGEAQPMVSYTYPDGRVIRMHSACDNVWHEERERP